MRKKVIALILCIAMLLAVVPLNDSVDVSASSNAYQENYGSAIGNTAKFNTDYWASFLVFNKPQDFIYDGEDNDWDKDEYWLYCETDNESPDIAEEHLLVITNYYWDEVTTALWYRVEAAPGYTLPEKMEQYPWVFQNYTDSELTDEDMLLISDTGKNIIFDGNGNVVTEETLPFYDTMILECKSTLQGKVSYQWQIFINDLWIDIYGEKEAEISVTIDMLMSALNENLTAYVRCISVVGSKSVTGEPIAITVEPYSGEQTDAVMYSVNSYALVAATENEDEDTYCYVTVKYLFQNGTEAANPFVAKVLKNEPLDVSVDFPTVQGYLPYYENEQRNSLNVNQTVTENITYTVYYLPTDVEYRIDVYFQNVNDDGYTFQSTETLMGLTGSQVPRVTVSYEGMYELLHETPEIAANGSTKIEVYFNRVYYLTHFELDGGYGVYSIYARYGSKLADNIGTPIKAGYTFVGWDDISDGSGDGIVDIMPETVPAKEQSFKAIWKENPTAEVRIAFWGENPNDEGYSYLESQTLSVKPGTVLTYGDGGYICGLEEHTHGIGCTYQCGLTAHTHGQSCYTLTCDKEHIHTDGCYTCGQSGHTHDISCYPDVGSTSSPWNVPSDPVNGQIASASLYGYTLYSCIYINGTWYSYSGSSGNGTIVSPTCGKGESTHNHTDACLGCGKTEHSHSDYIGSCYTLTCTQTPHTHTADCYSCLAHQHSDSCQINEFESYDSTKWTFVKSDTVTVAADGSTVLNVYFDRTTFTLTFRANNNTVATITEKWGAKISDEFEQAPFNTTYNGRAWECTDEKKYGYALQTLDIMPGFDATFDLYNKSSNTLKTIYYYVENVGVDVSESTWPTNTSNFTLLKTVDTYFKYATYKEEYHEMEGYIRYSAGVAGFNNNRKDFSNNELYLYYLRDSYRLEFYNGSSLAREESMLYEESFAKFSDYVPELPEEYEPGSRKFVGWYLNPECTGEQVDLTKMTMPAENMALYAKWELVYHTVNIYKEKYDDGTFGDKVLSEDIAPALHGNTVFETNFTMPIPENRPYSFIGWFYMDGDTERMWDFEHSVVVKDTDIYAKWSAEVLVPYTVRFVIQNEDGTVTEIADAISSSALAGTTVTFDAKGGMELYTDYQTGYFPVTPSHSLTMDVKKAEEGMTYDFVYLQKENMPYKVRYVDENGNDFTVPQTKVVENNTYAIVTEKFVYIEGYVPDEYKKTLILDADNPDANVIIFYYKKDSTQSVYNVTHYIRSTDGINYMEHTSYGDIGTIGDELKIKPLELKGFTYDYALVNGVRTDFEPADETGTVNGTIPKEGLEIKLYYERNKYPYKIQYLDKDTLAVLKTPDIITDGAYYGTVVTVSNPPTIENYKLSSVSSCVITEEDSTHPTKNIVNVYYSEQTVRITYEVVGPDGCGSVSPTYTDVKVLSGTGATSTATANEGFLFMGWYEDADCTRRITTNQSLNLTIPDDKVWKSATYYAKFIPEVSNLTIERENAADEKQVFVYEIKNNKTGEIINVTVVGNGKTIIHDLPMGEYTVTQQNKWSWRYSNESISISHQSIDGTTVTFDKTADTEQWLNGNSELIQNKRRESK